MNLEKKETIWKRISLYSSEIQVSALCARIVSLVIPSLH